jgi:TPR repeat protein
MSGRRRLPAALLLAGVLLAQALVSSAQAVPIETLRQRAEQGDMDAQYWLCYHYWKGEGRQPDYAAAAGYCEKAAQLGHPKAMAVLGSMCRSGQGVPKDYGQALQFLGFAANAGLARADYELGLMYKNGEGVLADYAQADMHFCRAAKGGERMAREECSETKSHIGGFQMGGLPMGQGRGRQVGSDDMLRPEAGGVVRPGANPAALSPEQMQRSMQRWFAQMTPAQAAQPKAAAVQAPASNAEEVSLDKAVSLQSNPPSQGSGSAARAPEPAAVPVPVAPDVEPRQPRRAFALRLIAAGLLSSLLGGLAYFGFNASRSSRGRIPERIRGLLGAGPRGHKEIADLYGAYCKRGGQAEVFSSGELEAIVASLDAVGRAFPAPGLGCAKALELAGQLAASGKTVRMQDVLSESVLVAAAASGRADEVLVLLAKSKSLEDFAAHFSAPGRPADFYSAYASGLARLGFPAQAYKMLAAKPLERFGPADQVLLLELQVKLGRFDQIGFLLEQVARIKPPAAAKDYYEELAKQADLHGGQRLAEDLRAIAAGNPIQGAKGRPPARAGQVLAGKYELRALISSGGMGEVYDGHDRSLDRRVAVKRLLPGLLVDPALREKFLMEAKAAAQLNHPYIVPIYEGLVSGDDVYLVFEFVKGETLHGLLTRRSRLALKECQGLFNYVCQALDYAHGNQVLHRDLKPANIMLDGNGIARVMDFGIAVEATGSLAGNFVDQRSVSGTLRYMSPEQHYGKTTRASDVYSLGVCLYEMTTGCLPFNAPSVPEVVKQKSKGEFPAPSAHVPELPQEFDALISMALAPEPQARMQGALELYEALAKIPS